MKKIVSFILLFIFSMSLMLSGCTPAPATPTLATPVNVSVDEDGLITWDAVANADTYVIKINDTEYTTDTTQYQAQSVINDFTFSVQAKGNNYLPSAWTQTYTFEGQGEPLPPTPPASNISVAISLISDIPNLPQDYLAIAWFVW